MAYRALPSPGSMLTYNMNDGYLEALVRGFKSGLLSRVDYDNLAQCDTLEGLSFFLILYLLQRYEIVSSSIYRLR